MMTTADGKRVIIYSAELIHDEPAKLGKAQYQDSGKWVLEICDMDRRFSSAVGYEFYYSDHYMGYSVYRKTVTAEVFTGIRLCIFVVGVRYDVILPIPDRLREEIFRCAEREGDTLLSHELAERIAAEYGADTLCNSIRK